MNIPMFGALKRCTPLVNLVLSVVVLGKPLPSPLLATSVGVITAGVFIASLGDLEFDGHAYTMGILSVFAQVGGGAGPPPLHTPPAYTFWGRT